MALIEVYNPATGTLQFSENQYPFNLKQVITVDCSTFGNPVTLGGNTGSRPTVYYSGYVDIGTSRAIVATSGTLFHSVLRLDSNGQIYLITQRGSGFLYIYVFVKGAINQRDDTGVTIYGPDNSIIFTADDKPLKPLGTAPYTAPTDEEAYSPPVLSFPGKTVAYVHTAQAELNRGEYSTENQGFRSILRGWGSTNGDSITMNYVTYVRLRVGAQENDQYVTQKGVVTAIDVTNY